MTEALQRLVFCSRNRIDRTPMVMSAALQAILASSRRNNPRLGITGALIFNAGSFGEVLEGPESAMEHLFERLQQDERHCDCTLLGLGPREGRTFDTWSMAYAGATEEDARAFAWFGEKTGYDAARMDSERLLQVLVQLVLDKEFAK